MQIDPSHYRGEPQLGWASHDQMGSLPRRSRDIQALMKAHLPTSPYYSVQDLSGTSHVQNGSATSIDIRHELFSSGSTTVSPHGSTTVSPHGSTTVSPQQSMRFMSPEGSNVLNADAHSPPDSKVTVKSRENLQKDILSGRGVGVGGDVSRMKRRRRSASAYPGARSSQEHQEHAVSSGKDALFKRSPQNGIMHHPEHVHPLPPHPHHNIGHSRRGVGGREEGTRGTQERGEEGGPKIGSMYRRHTHSGSHAHSHDAYSDVTEI